METKPKKSWKNLFVNDENNKETLKETSTKFPESKPFSENAGSVTFPKNTETTFKAGQPSQEHLDKFMDIYEKKFTDLNQPNYDFFEFFQSIVHGDINNPQTYAMAFGMGSAMDKTISKEKLLTQADFYITELNNVYDQYVAQGAKKKQELTDQKQSETQSLSSDLNSLKEQLEAIKIQIQDRENKLSLVDGKYAPEIFKVDSQFSANAVAKNKILSKIEQVKQGITNNLK